MRERSVHVLIADDESDVLAALRLLFKNEGYQVVAAQSSSEVKRLIEHGDIDLVLMDLNYTRGTVSGEEGLNLLSTIQAIDNTIPVIVMTAWGSVELAVESMRRGAQDFVTKPWKNERLLNIVRTQVELARTRQKSERLAEQNRFLREDSGVTFIAESRAMEPVLALIERTGPSDANILVTGENGTGKGLVARMIHQVSERSENPLVTVHIASLSPSVLESELFGHVKGAFTDAKQDRVGRFEVADSGTLFLDEIADIPMEFQTKLLRVIENGEFERVGSSKTHQADVRIISATNSPIHEDVAEGRFRNDLLYRLNTVEIHLPPLRERAEDIPLLAHQALQQHAARYRKSVVRIGNEALDLLMRHTWPGNVRELDHVIERAVLMTQGDVLCVKDMGLETKSANENVLDNMTLNEAERYMISSALEQCSGNVNVAAQKLGLSRSALYRRIEKLGLSTMTMG